MSSLSWMHFHDIAVLLDASLVTHAFLLSLPQESRQLCIDWFARKERETHFLNIDSSAQGYGCIPKSKFSGTPLILQASITAELETIFTCCIFSPG